MGSKVREEIKRIAEAQSAGVTMIPAALAPPPKEEATIPDLSELVKNRKCRLAMARLIAELGDINTDISAVTKRKNELTAKLKQLAGEYKIGKAVSGEWRMNYYASERKSINSGKLLAAGVSFNTIAACTDVKEIYTLKVSRLGEEDEAE